MISFTNFVLQLKRTSFQYHDKRRYVHNIRICKISIFKKIRQVDAVTQIQPKLIEWKFNSNSFVVFVQLCVICLMELNTHVELAQT